MIVLKVAGTAKKNIPAVVFKGLLTTLAGQFISQNHAECVDEDFGFQPNGSRRT
jgi:hypothetical protein